MQWTNTAAADIAVRSLLKLLIKFYRFWAWNHTHHARTHIQTKIVIFFCTFRSLWTLSVFVLLFCCCRCFFSCLCQRGNESWIEASKLNNTSNFCKYHTQSPFYDYLHCDKVPAPHTRHNCEWNATTYLEMRKNLLLHQLSATYLVHTRFYSNLCDCSYIILAEKMQVSVVHFRFFPPHRCVFLFRRCYVRVCDLNIFCRLSLDFFPLSTPSTTSDPL